MSRVIDAIQGWARTRPRSLALTGRDVALTWAELARLIDDTARELEHLWSDISPEAPVAFVFDNGPAWIVLDLALVRLGRASLPLPPFFTREQMAHAVADAGCAILVRPPQDEHEVTRDLCRVPLVFQTLPFPVRALQPGTAKITYTSGSTAQPRGVCLSQDQMETTAAALVDVIGAEFAGVHMPVLPLGVLLENVAGLYAVLLAGGRYHAASLTELGFVDGLRPDAARIAHAVVANGVTSLILTPELLRGLTAWLVAKGVGLPSLKLVAVGGAKVAPRLLGAARAAGLPAYEGYGLTECASVVALNTPAADAPGTAGRILPHLRASISPDGEILVGPDTFLGYLGGPAHSGTWATGDLGWIDPEGFVRISGRKSNLLITAYGRNVAPEWVESELLAQPEIAQAVVFGDGAAELCAVLVPSSPDTALETAVNRANAALPVYARVGRWRSAPCFEADRGELTRNGRPRRAALRAAHIDFIDLQS